MPITNEEVIDIKSSMIVLTRIVSELTDAQINNAASQSKLAESITALLIEMREKDIKDEHLKEEVKEIRGNQNRAMDYAMPIVRRAEVNQKRADAFKASIESGWGKMIAGAIVAASLLLLAQALGIDLQTVVTK